jgi:MFS family permease
MSQVKGAAGSAAAEWRSFWYLPIAGALGYATSVLHVYSLGPFVAPLQQEFGWSRAQVFFGITISSIISALFCIPVGRLVDRVGPRKVGLIGVLAMAAAYALLGTATGQNPNWYLLWTIVAVGTFFVQATVWTSAVASRFEISRGLAFAITLCGASIAQVIFPLIVTRFIGAEGWRTAFWATGALWATFVFPIVFFGFRGARDQKTNVSVTAVEPRILSGVSLSDGLRSSAMYKLLMSAALFSFTVIGVAANFVPILTDAGVTPQKAAAISSLIGIFSIVGRLGTGFLLDRFPGHKVGAMAFLIPIVACVLLLFFGSNPFSHVAAAAIFGLTVGSEVDVIAYLAAKHFGLKSFGALYGVLQMALAAGTAFGPLAAGAVFDHNGNYRPFLLLTIVLMTTSAIAIFSLRTESHHVDEGSVLHAKAVD